MTKYILVLLFFYPLIAKSQTLIISSHVTSQSHLGFEVLFGKSILIGFGGEVFLGEKGIGTDYSKVFGVNTYPNDIYKINSDVKTGSGYFCIAKSFNKFFISGNLGMGSIVTFYDGYDKLQILSPNGYWYVKTINQNIFVIGIHVNYRISEYLILKTGFDNYSNFKIGAGLIID